MKNLSDITPRAGGSFGKWFTDEFGLPAYEYECRQDSDPRAPRFTTCGPSALHWHAFGNSRFNVIATNRGDAQALESSRGLQWLNFFDPEKKCPGAGVAAIDCENHSWSDLYDGARDHKIYRRVFGSSYFRKILEYNDLLTDNIIFSPVGDDPVLAAILTINNTGSAPKKLRFVEFFGINLHYLSAAPVYSTSERKHFMTTPFANDLLAGLAKLSSQFSDVKKNRTDFSLNFLFDSNLQRRSARNILVVNPVFTGKNRPFPSEASSKNFYPYPMFLMTGGSANIFSADASRAVGGSGKIKVPSINRSDRKNLKFPCLAAGAEIELAPGEELTYAFIFGYCAHDEMDALTDRYSGAVEAPQKFMLENFQRVAGAVPALTVPAGPWNDEMTRETKWHSCYCVNSFLHDEWYELHYLPQGGPYEYLHGFRGCVRDLALYSMALTYLDPSLTRELILYLFHQMTPGGRLMYSAHGFGKATGAVIHENPSDLQLFLFMALTEYIFFTRDFDILDENVFFYGEKEKPATVMEGITLAVNYLFNVVGTGPHGLLRAGDGDWNDGISMFVKNRFAFVKRGESSFNTAMALYALPRISALIKDRAPAMAQELLSKTDELKSAILQCRNDRWFFRGYDGRGKPIGDREIFLEHHNWLLISEALGSAESNDLIGVILERLDNPSPFGQFVLNPPINSFMNQLTKGWDVNGGTWFAMSFLLTWAYSKYDPALGWNSLIKNSMAMKATVAPDIWYGIWSGPDSFNACHADRPGETFFHLPTPCTDFPVMNMNLHGGFISSLVKLCGIEPGIDGALPSPRLPFKDFSFRTPTFSITSRNGSIDFAQTLKSD